MTDISKEAVEREICTPIINYVADGRGMSEDTLAGIIDKSRAMSTRIAELEAVVRGYCEEGHLCPEGPHGVCCGSPATNEAEAAQDANPSPA